jgi:lysophospholipid acyltransferase (LPLAT)-like uncharacterized protein
LNQVPQPPLTETALGPKSTGSLQPGRPETVSPKPANPASRVFSGLTGRIRNGAFYLATTLITHAFLFFESTLDVRVYGLERLRELKRAGHSPLLVIWHGQGLVPMATFRHERLCLYASNTRNPDYARSLLILRWWTLRFIERLGYRVLDAFEFKSESRGVLQFVEILRGGTGSVIAADGPAGPIYRAKPGPTFLAKKSGVVLLPLGAALSGGFHMDQWDRFEIPWPFAHAVIVIGEPISVPANAKEAELEQYRVALESEMHRRMEEASRRLKTQGLETMEQVEGERSERDQQSADQERVEQEKPGRGSQPGQ